MADSVARLHNAVIAARGADPAQSRTARLLRSGRAKIAKKLGEEAVEVVIDAMHGQTEAVVRESADLLYNLVVLWVDAGIHPDDVWAEMRRRESLFGIAEKLPKDPLPAAPMARKGLAKPLPKTLPKVLHKPLPKVVHLDPRQASKVTKRR